MIPARGSGGGVIPQRRQDRQCPECRPTPPPGGGPGPQAAPGFGSGPRIRLDPGERDAEAASLRPVPAVRGPLFISVWGIPQLSRNADRSMGTIGDGCPRDRAAGGPWARFRRTSYSDSPPRVPMARALTDNLAGVAVCATGLGRSGRLGALRGGDSGGRRPSPWSYRKVQPFPRWGWEIGLHSRYEICHRCGFVETVAALPGNSGSVHAIRLGIKPFAKLGANSLSLSGSEGDSSCSRRTILGLAPVTVLQSRFVLLCRFRRIICRRIISRR